MADRNSLFSFRCSGFYIETGGAPLWAPQYVTRQEFRKGLPRPKTVTSPPDRNDLPISAAAPRRDLPVSPTLPGSDWRSRRVSLRHPSGSLTHNGPTYTFRVGRRPTMAPHIHFAGTHCPDSGCHLSHRAGLLIQPTRHSSLRRRSIRAEANISRSHQKTPLNQDILPSLLSSQILPNVFPNSGLW